MTSGVLPSDSLGLKTALLTWGVQPAVPAPRSTSGVRVRQRFLTEAPLKNRPILGKKEEKGNFNL